jgi:CDP-diacylglycerol--glycerol-3-phosphate 3-phosphatidyltransferase/cardiolipin synthase
MLGKAATLLQIIAVISVLIGNHVPIPALTTIWWVTVASTFVSGLFYMYRGVKQL